MSGSTKRRRERASYRSERLANRLGFVPRYSNQMALIRNYDWYVEHRGEYRGRTGVTHRVPWKKGALAIGEMVLLAAIANPPRIVRIVCRSSLISMERCCEPIP